MFAVDCENTDALEERRSCFITRCLFPLGDIKKQDMASVTILELLLWQPLSFGNICYHFLHGRYTCQRLARAFFLSGRLLRLVWTFVKLLRPEEFLVSIIRSASAAMSRTGSLSFFCCRLWAFSAVNGSNF